MADIDPFEGAPALPKIVAVSLQQTGHLYNFLAGDRPLRRGERVLVESEAGADRSVDTFRDRIDRHTIRQAHQARPRLRWKGDEVGLQQFVA